MQEPDETGVALSGTLVAEEFVAAFTKPLDDPVLATPKLRRT